MAVLRGVILGALNTLVIAIGIAAWANSAELFLLVLVLGCLPGMVAGAVLGWIAKRMARQRPALRAAVLATLAVVAVVAIATPFEANDLVEISCIPTFVAVLLLERGTRIVEPPPVPVATARSA